MAADISGTRWLDDIDPAAWNEAIERLASPPGSPGEAIAFLAAFGKEAEDDLLEAFERSPEDPVAQAAARNRLLETAVTGRSWQLGRSLGRGGFERLPELLPELTALRGIVDVAGADVPLPAACAGAGAGLRGCLSTFAARACLNAVAPFASIKDVCAALRAVKPRGLGRLFGGSSPAAGLASELDNDQLDGHWKTLRTALQETVASGHHLGLGIRP